MKYNLALEQASAFVKTLADRLGLEWDSWSKHDSQFYAVYGIPAGQRDALLAELRVACPDVIEGCGNFFVTEDDEGKPMLLIDISGLDGYDFD